MVGNYVDQKQMFAFFLCIFITKVINHVLKQGASGHTVWVNLYGT